MRSACAKEIEYLSAMDGKQEDPRLINEMSRRLDALRRYDQLCCANERTGRRRQPSGIRGGKSA